MTNNKVRQNPYYIVAPLHATRSAGHLLAYILCRSLHKKGCDAFVILENMHFSGSDTTHPQEFGVNVISQTQALEHIQLGLHPIVIRSEGRIGSILKGFCTFRYIMNYIGFFAHEPQENDPEFQIDKKYFWAFSSDIAKRHNISQDRVMFTPIVDTKTFFPPKENTERKEKACYLGKYYEQFSREVPAEIDNSFYVFYRGGKKNHVPSREEYAEKLRNSEVLYIYENTSVLTEALMCGCPVVCVPNPYCQFTEKDMIGLQEIGLNGIAIGTSKEEIEQAKATVHLARERILELIEKYDEKVDYFIKVTQEISQEVIVDKVLAEKSIRKIFSIKKQNKVVREIVRPLKKLKHKLRRYYLLRSYTM